jgi:uncharacterized membrane protein SpoIIM required for sporulation
MLKKSASIYLGGFVFGFFASAVLLVVYPTLYYASLEFLRQKVVSQSKVIENLTLMIIVNNLIAAAIASFGGAGVSKIVNLIDHKFAKNKAILYFLPVGILFVNGEVLGLLAVLFVDNIRGYLYGIFPHGFFEIPAIILSGSIGLEISEECQKANETFQEHLTMLVRSKLSKFTLVILLIILGGFLEGGAL